MVHSVMLGQDAGPKVLKALGLEDRRVTRIVIDLQVDCVARIIIDEHLSECHLDNLLGLIVEGEPYAPNQNKTEDK